MMLILASTFLVLNSLTLHYIDPSKWVALQRVPALTLPVKVMFAIDWRHIMPWH